MGLLTEAEAAARLGVTKSKIKRLRKIGGLPFLKGRPVLIEEDDLVAFQIAEAAQKAQAAAEAATAAKRKQNPGPEIGSPEYEEEQRDNLYRRVLQTRLKQHYRNLRREKAKDGR